MHPVGFELVSEREYCTIDTWHENPRDKSRGQKIEILIRATTHGHKDEVLISAFSTL